MAIIIVTAVAITACSSDNTTATSPTPSIASSPATPASRTGDQLCELLSTDEITQATKVTTAKKQSKSGLPINNSHCTWYNAEGTVVAVALNVYSKPGTPATELIDEIGAFKDTKGPTPGIGEKSYYQLGGSHTNAGVTWAQGDEVWSIGVSTGNVETVDEATDRSVALELARLVSSRI